MNLVLLTGLIPSTTEVTLPSLTRKEKGQVIRSAGGKKDCQM